MFAMKKSTNETIYLKYLLNLNSILLLFIFLIFQATTQICEHFHHDYSCFLFPRYLYVIIFTLQNYSTKLAAYV